MRLNVSAVSAPFSRPFKRFRMLSGCGVEPLFFPVSDPAEQIPWTLSKLEAQAHFLEGSVTLAIFSTPQQQGIGQGTSCGFEAPTPMGNKSIRPHGLHSD
jgi:hypothetical protein